MLKPYLQIETDTLRTRARQVAEEPAPTADTLSPLPVRLKKVLAQIPPELAQEGVSLEFIRERLSGRQKGRKAQAGEVATALRALGWTRTRCWRKGDPSGFRALWHKGEEC